MQSRFVRLGCAVMLTVLAMLVVNPVLADKPSAVGGDNKRQDRDVRGGSKQRERDGDRGGNKHEVRDNRSESKRREQDDDRGGKRSDRGERHFDEHQYVLVREYYVTEQRAGHCPPGLAKKNNGCMPPGQAKKWRKGRHLPRDVVFHNLPSRLEVQLGAPPSGHRFVRVAADILLIAVGTGMVVDAIEDLGRM